MADPLEALVTASPLPQAGVFLGSALPLHPQGRRESCHVPTAMFSPGQLIGPGLSTWPEQGQSESFPGNWRLGLDQRSSLSGYLGYST